MAKVDFDVLAKEPRYEALVSEEVRADRKLRRIKLLTAVGVLGSITAACLVLILADALLPVANAGLASSSSVERARTIVQTLLGGVIGFWAGQRDEAPVA